MKRLLFIILGLMIVGCCDVRMGGVERARVIGDSTVGLVHEWRGNVRVYCAGVWVSKNVIMTANHCIEGMSEQLGMEELILGGVDPLAVSMGLVEVPKVEVLDVEYIVREDVIGDGENPEKRYSGKVWNRDVSHDLAMIVVSGSPWHSVAEIGNKVEVGESVYTMGHPTGLYWSYMSGVVSAKMDHIEMVKDVSGPFIQVSMPIFNGNSGGGLFDEEGHLLGIVSFMPPRVPSVGFMIGLESIRGFMMGSGLMRVSL